MVDWRESMGRRGSCQDVFRVNKASEVTHCAAVRY
jgi:hypothetical protein